MVGEFLEPLGLLFVKKDIPFPLFPSISLNLQKVDLAVLSFDGTKIHAQPLDHRQETIADITAKIVEPL